MKTLSCGILVMNPLRGLLLCHVTGAWHWDIPKGTAEAGESPRQAALRETFEECGLALQAVPLLDLGRHAYRPRKDLHLFAVLVDDFDAKGTCRCTSHFTDPWGRVRPEMDAFEWTPLARVSRRCARHMAALLTNTVPLPPLLARLQGLPPAETARLG